MRVLHSTLRRNPSGFRPGHCFVHARVKKKTAGQPHRFRQYLFAVF